jgi:hypothetical protein
MAVSFISFKILCSQLLLALVAASAIVGIKFTADPRLLKTQDGNEDPIKAPLPSVDALEGSVGKSGIIGPVGSGVRASPHVTTPITEATVAPSDVPYQHTHGIYKRAHKYGDLPALRGDMSPDSELWVNSIAICACMFGENTTDIREWILYNRCVLASRH